MRALLAVLGALALAPAVAAQSVLDRSPNLYGVWTLPSGRGAFIFAHRFELRRGGDELLNIPTMTLAFGLPLRLTAGLDYSSNSDVLKELGGNEVQLWLKRAFPLGASTTLAGIAGYNTAAGSADAALSLRQGLGRLGVFGEGRAYSDLFGAGEAGAAAVLGASLRLTPFLALTADVARAVSEDTFPAAWSAAAAIAIPGTPHTFSLQATNAGSITLHGAAHERTGIFSDVRYGFVFTAPLGTAAQWARIFRPAAPPPPAGDPPLPSAPDAAVAARVEIRQTAFSHPEIHIRPGEAVEWVNLDPVAHTVTAAGGSWVSAPLREGERFVHRFERPGRYAYHCAPHPGMSAVVVVQPRREPPPTRKEIR